MKNLRKTNYLRLGRRTTARFDMIKYLACDATCMQLQFRNQYFPCPTLLKAEFCDDLSFHIVIVLHGTA
jgi:hypothetical protein